jgi:F-type H+-transporting ATPase subunit gamma
VPSLKAIRTRITSVRSTQKITTAMKLVAAAKLRRAQDAIFAARPYASRLRGVVGDLVGPPVGGPDDSSAVRNEGALHPMLASRTVHRVGLVVLTSDRGLAGGFNSNILRQTERLSVEHKAAGQSVQLHVVGRKGRDHFRRRPGLMGSEWPGAVTDQAATRARELAHHVRQSFESGEADVVYVVYNEFKSALTQRVVVHQLLPVLPDGRTEPGPRELVFEPSRETLLNHLLPKLVETELLGALLESAASELGARMTAMDSATINARDMIASLTLQFNRARQAAITKELMEIIGGAEALKG